MKNRPSREESYSSEFHSDSDSFAAFDQVLAASNRQLGPYRLLQEIGVGGMGVVWLAEQEKPVRRRVALKLIKAGRDPQIVARFQADRQALSMMDHENIAKVLDAGASESGTPYFVMQLVQGDPINKYCDRHKLTIRERLELFVPICDAVQHAHHKGVLHRDLKPSNVLVHIQNDQPVPKVIDFGVAKATQHQTKLTDQTVYTEFGQIVGTVQYMSPEQARIQAKDVDTRSDVYSLGAMLYELLTGSTPLDADAIQSHDVLRLLEIIRDAEPERPSQRIAATVSSDPTIAENRRVAATKLKQQLGGDLDWIVMKSLEKDRARRYATPQELADDIRQHLDGDIVSARPPTIAYRSRKFVTKHRGWVAAALLFSSVIIAGTASVAWFAIEAERQRATAEIAQEDAEISAKRSSDILQLVTDSFAAVDPDAGADASMTARDVLLHARENLHESGLDEIGRGILLDKLTTCLGSIGEFDASVDTAKEAYEIYKSVLGAEDQETLRQMNQLAVAYRRSSRTDEAILVLEETYELRKRVLGETHEDTLVSAGNLALAYQTKGRMKEAIRLHEFAYEGIKAKLGKDALKTLTGRNNLGRAYRMAGRIDEAIPLLEETLEQRQRLLGTDHPKTLISMGNLAGALHDAGEIERALELYEETAKLMRLKLGADHPHTLTTLSGIGYCLTDAGRYDEAVTIREGLRETINAKYGNAHPKALRAGKDLGRAYQRAGRLNESITLLKETIDGCIDVFGKADSRTLRAIQDLANSYSDQEEFEKAETLLREIYAIRKAVEPNGKDTWYALSKIGSALLNQGLIEESCPPLLDSYQGLKSLMESQPDDPPKYELRRAIERLVRLYKQTGDQDAERKMQAELEELKDS